MGCSVFAQDTYNCPDGWEKEEDRSGCRCFLISESEAVTRDDADVLCAAHGSWVAELDHPGINYWLKSKLLDVTEPGRTEQFWLGAESGERHSENAPGEWTWPHKNETVSWFDWADGEPNNQQGEYCLVMREYHDPSSPSSGITSGMILTATRLPITFVRNS